ncbi:Hypothetical predicted protein [Paramuricea clavata]|uniref:Uncharacterized protein n=1 Tax=Paramuricea clavata TaxID=317549 RepID=A0A7D9LJH2_PARCT|nr:Hypothetical predicted protein [Paramuricea clavata]
MAEELKTLVKIRGGHRASLTKTLAVTEELLTQSTEIFEETQASDFEIKLTQQRVILGEKLPLLKSFDDKIILLVEDGNIEDEVASADDIRQAIQRAIVHIDLILEKLKKKWNKDSGSSPSNLESSLSQATVPPTSNSTVRLPKLELKHFNGNIMEWTTFWDSYSSSIHENPNFSGIDKFNYLHSLLEKSAAEAISGLKITSANYQEAIDILDKRFGNQQQIVNAHMNALLNLPKVTNVDDLKALRQLHDKVESHMRGLKSLEVDSGSYGSLLTPILIDKLPKELRLEVTKQLKEDWDLDELIKIFKRELEARERASLLPGSSRDPPSKPPYKPKKDPSKTLQARLIFDSGSQRSCITSTIRDKLNLPIVRRDTLKINAFGSKDEDITSCDMVQFQLDTERGHKLNLSAYVVPLICFTIGNQNTKFAQQSYEHLSGIRQNEENPTIGQSTTDVVNDVCTEDKSYCKSTVGNPQELPLEREEKILGIRWNYVNDTFIFNFQRIVQAARELEPTKRNVIGIISRFYDPLGVLAPITVKLKMFFQELCQSKVEWDE